MIHLSRAALFGLFFDPGEERVALRCVSSRFRWASAVADPEDVVVRVGQSRHDRLALEIDRARGGAGIFLRLFVRADEDDAVAFDSDRFGLR